MPCCPHCIEYFGDAERTSCAACGHPRTCAAECSSLFEIPLAPPEFGRGIDEDLTVETPYRERFVERAREIGRALRSAIHQHGPSHPRTSLLRLDLLEIYVDPEWEDFDSYTALQRARVESCADVLLRAEPTLPEGEKTVRFRLRLARIFYDVRSPAKADALAGSGLARQDPPDGPILTDLQRLGWSALCGRRSLDIAEQCYRRVVAGLRESGREYLDPLDCLQRVLTAQGRATEARVVGRQVDDLRAQREASRRQRLLGTLSALQSRWEVQGRCPK